MAPSDLGSDLKSYLQTGTSGHENALGKSLELTFHPAHATQQGACLYSDATH
jgi:hypothetical protein